MSAAGTLVGGGTSQVLNAASGAIAGGEARINNDVLRSKSIEIILQQMNTDRATQGTNIDARLQVTDNPGSNQNPPKAIPYIDMYDAANDLYKYARAGSWTDAILSLQVQTGAQAQACAKKQNDAHVFGQAAPPAGQTPNPSNCPLAPSPSPG